MQIRSRTRLVPGPLATAVATLLALVSMLFVAAPAAAQVAELVGSPLTTKRLERLLRIYVDPTPAEATAIDSIHEAYLDRFRAELDPEIKQVGQSINSSMPSRPEFEKFLRDMNRIQQRIAEIDKAFFDSAVALVAPERRAGIERIRSARERQRELSGFSRMGSTMFGGGASFVDLPNMLARERYLDLIAPEMRAQFDALLLEQERRTLTQARSYSAGVRKSMTKVWEAAAAIEAEGPGGGDGRDAGDDPAAAAAAQMQRMSAMVQAMREAGEEPRKVVNQNFQANRAATRQFVAVLPEIEVLRLREDVAKKSAGMLGGMMAMSGGSFSMGGDAGDVLRRVRRDPTVAPEIKAALAPIELTWRRERADSSEKLVDISLSLDITAMMMEGMNGDGGEGGGARADLEAESKRRALIDQRALNAIAALLGDETSTRFLAKRRFAQGGGDDSQWVVIPNPAAAEDEDADVVAWRPSFTSSAELPAPISVPDVISKLRLCGVDVPAPELLEAVVEGWKSREWEAKVVPLSVQLREARRNLYPRADSGDFTPDPTARATERSTLRAIAEAVVAADRALCIDLAMTLDLKPDGPEMALLRLERVALLREDGNFDGITQAPPTPARVIAAARIDTSLARALLETELPQWNALVEELPALFRASVQRAEDLDAATRDATGREGWERTRTVMARNSEATREFAARLSELYRSAAEKASESPQVRASIRHAFLSVLRPDVYRPSENALTQLDRAIALDGLTPEQRGRLDALRAEYDAVYNDLSAKIADSGSTVVSRGDDADFRAMSERAEALAKVRFERTERTEKARAETRRILGDSLAKRVRGLVPDEDSETSARSRMAFNPFVDDDD